MRACQLGKGRNCREGRGDKQGDWRIFEQSETILAVTRNPCRSGLARDGVGEPTTAIAGKPAPTGSA